MLNARTSGALQRTNKAACNPSAPIAGPCTGIGLICKFTCSGIWPNNMGTGEHPVLVSASENHAEQCSD